MKDTYTDIKNSFDVMRSLNKDKVREALNKLVESEDKDFNETEGVPYTMNDEMMKNIIETTKSNFGADYSGLKNPMMYYQNSGNIILNGVVPSLNNLQFRFIYPPKDGIGCYLWHAENMALNDANVSELAKMVGSYKNWKEELDNMTDKKPMNLKN